jgi:alginate O-acetyltransferase complex protein AlgI
MANRARVFRHLYALIVILAGWVLFRAETIPQALAFYGAMVGLGRGSGIEYTLSSYLNSQLLIALAIGILFSTPIVVVMHKWQERLIADYKGAGAVVLQVFSRLINLVTMAIIFIASAALSAAGTYNPFIYFRF